MLKEGNLLNGKQMAQALSISTRTLRRWRDEGLIQVISIGDKKGTKRPGSILRYDKEAVLFALEKKKIRPRQNSW